MSDSRDNKYLMNHVINIEAYNRTLDVLLLSD